MWLGPFSRPKPAEVCTALQTPVLVEEALPLRMSAVKYSQVLTALKTLLPKFKTRETELRKVLFFFPETWQTFFFLPNNTFIKLSWWSLPKSFYLLFLSLLSQLPQVSRFLVFASEQRVSQAAHSCSLQTCACVSAWITPLLNPPPWIFLHHTVNCAVWLVFP